MCKDMTFKIIDEKNNRFRAVRIDKDIYYNHKTDFAPFLLTEYGKVLCSDKIMGKRINATEELRELARSLPCLGGRDSSRSIETDTGEKVFFNEDGTMTFLPIDFYKKDHKVQGYYSWLKSWIENRRKNKDIKQMATKNEVKK
jgi:hypothetical protein